LDGGNTDRIMDIDVPGGSKTVTITGITFTNGDASNDDGGAIAVTGDDDLTISGSTFTDNHADYDGGAIYVDDAASDLTITGSTFTDNTADYEGGAISINNGATLTVTDSTFTGNSAGSDGGALYLEDEDLQTTITGSTFTDNTADDEGGAVALDDGSTLTVTDSTFTGNTSDDDGGALYLDDSDLLTTITGSTFTDNTSDSGGSGGAIAINDGRTLDVTGSTFTANHATYNGGALYLADGDLETTVTGSTFTDNTAGTGEYQYGSGGAIDTYDGRTLEITASAFAGNSAVDDGGAIRLDDPDLVATITGVTITGNTAGGGEYAYGDGGGIAANDAASVTVSWSTIAGNSAEQDGGGLYLDQDGSATITNTTISGNTAGEGGGGVHITVLPSGVSMFNSTVSGNTAGAEGGGIYLRAYTFEGTYYNAPLDLVQVTITDNTATTIGGIFIADVDQRVLQSAESTRQQDAAAAKTAEVKAEDNDAPDEVLAPAEVQAATTALVGQVVLSGTIVAGNTGTDIGESGEALATSSLIGTITGTTLTDQGGNLLGVNPLLGALADNGGPTQTHALLPGSPAIDAGPNPLTPFPGSGNDQRGDGYLRVIAGVVDIGAFEVQPLPPVIQPTFTG
ncbi:MAG: right-handed parallel beta-helix repeat-containing protein, partial [Acidimicrobiia bacterium]